MKFVSPEQLLVISLILAVIPLMVVIATCYLKCSVVLSLLRGGFGTQQAPGNAMVMALSLVLSLAVMEPIGREVYGNVAALRPEELARLPLSSMLQKAAQVLEPWERFIREHCGERELRVFASHQPRVRVGNSDGGSAIEMAPGAPPASLVQILAAFVVSEIRRGFVAAFIVLIPFFVVDVIVANVLVGLGLTMMSPVVVSLPIKLLLFIACDGWLMLAHGIVGSYD